MDLRRRAGTIRGGYDGGSKRLGRSRASRRRWPPSSPPLPRERVSHLCESIRRTPSIHHPVRLNAIRPPSVYTSVAHLDEIPPHSHPKETHLMRSRILGLAAVLAFAPAVLAADNPSAKGDSKVPAVLNYKMKTLDGKDADLSQYQGKVLLVVNVASKCGNTPQYKALEELHEKFAGDIKWNFTKFLIGRDGEVVARFEPKVKPDTPEVVKAIEAELAKK